MNHPEDPMTALSTPDAAARPRRWRGRREEVAPTDSVDIDSEHNHDWWAQREELSRVVAPKRRGAGASSRARDAASRAFAPATGTVTDASTPTEIWDTQSLYAWGADAPAAGTGASDGTDDVELTPWALLGLTPDAHWLEVVRRHRTLAKQFHPDLHSDTDADTRRAAEMRMAEINVAFDTLLHFYGMAPGTQPTAV